jgi:hypothetical protein
MYAKDDTSLFLVRDLKRINDLVFNAPVEYYRDKKRTALDNIFGSLGVVDIDVFQEAIKQRIDAYKAQLIEGQTSRVHIERRVREKLEDHIQPEAGWKAELSNNTDNMDNSEVRVFNSAQLERMTYLVDSGQATVASLESLPSDVLDAVLETVTLPGRQSSIALAAVDGIDEREESLTRERPMSRWRLYAERPAPRWSLYGFFAGAARDVNTQINRAQRAIYGV